MGRLITFAAGILIGVVLKWQYDQQQPATVPTPSPQPTRRTPAGDVQVIAITVGDATRQAPASSAENSASLPNAE